MEQLFEVSIELPNISQLINLARAAANRELNVNISFETDPHARLLINFSKNAPTPLNLRNKGILETGQPAKTQPKGDR